MIQYYSVNSFFDLLATAANKSKKRLTEASDGHSTELFMQSGKAGFPRYLEVGELNGIQAKRFRCQTCE